MKEFRILSTF